MEYLKNIGVRLGLIIVFCYAISLHAEAEHRIPFTEVNGLMMVNVEYDGNSGVFIFDTGADHVIVHGISDERSNSAFDTVEGELPTIETSLDYLAMGDYVVEDLVVYQANLSHLKKHVAHNVLGIIGMSAFAYEVLQIDNINGEITLHSSDYARKLVKRSYHSMPFHHNGEVACVEVDIDGQDYLFALDSGSTVSLIAESAFGEQQSLFTSTGKQFDLNTSHNTAEGNTYYQSDAISIHQITLDEVDFGVIDLSAFPELGGILSIGALPSDEIVFDFTRGKMYLRK